MLEVVNYGQYLIHYTPRSTATYTVTSYTLFSLLYLRTFSYYTSKHVAVDVTWLPCIIWQITPNRRNTTLKYFKKRGNETGQQDHQEAEGSPRRNATHNLIIAILDPSAGPVLLLLLADIQRRKRRPAAQLRCGIAKHAIPIRRERLYVAVVVHGMCLSQLLKRRPIRAHRKHTLMRLRFW